MKTREDGPGELFERARQGDGEAFWRLIVPYRGLIFSVALGMLRDRERAEDQLHETLLAARPALTNLRDPRRLPGWLYTLTRNRCLDALRHDQRENRLLHDPAARPRVVPMADIMVQEEWLATMEEAIGQLPEPFRVILALKYMNHASCQEIAQIMDLSMPAVKSRLFEARKLLRKKTELLAEREKGLGQ